ncbi:MAG: hypothetical protein K2G99_01120, partial [Desulfovibrio sp.]|nr:hypothetical protein [Desulfovibrio sp.]
RAGGLVVVYTRQQRAEPRWAPPQRPAQAAPGGYTSPSVPVPGEWVGEPMPIPRKAPEAPPVSEPTAPAEAAHEEAPVAPAPAAEDAGSFMDFIVGATPVEASAPPKAAAPVPREPQSAPSAPGGMTDFVERSVSLVTSAVSSAFAPAAGAGEPDLQAPPAGDGRGVSASGPDRETAATTGPDAVILALVERLDAAMAQATAAHASGLGQQVAQAAATIAEESESYGFRVLARMARCVERAGRAGDMNALRDLLPELAVSVERNRIALTQRK